MSNLKEFRVLKTQSFDSRKAVNEYSIVVTHRMVAEPDSYKGVVLTNPNDMYIIASDLNEAAEMLCKAVKPNWDNQ